MAQPLSEDPLYGVGEPEFDPDNIEFRKFGTARRGYSPNEVRPYLAAIADALRDAQRREGETRSRLGKAIRRADQAETELEAAQANLAEVEARSQQVTAPPIEITDAELTERLGEQVAQVLHSAREAAETRVSQAQLRAREMFEAAEAEVTDIRWRAELVFGEKTAEAEAAAEKMIAAARQEASEIEEEAAQIIAESRVVANELLVAAQVEGEGLIQQAQEARFQILADMDTKRRTMRSQAERLKAGRDRLLQSHGVVQDTLNEIANELRASISEAKIKGDSAARSIEGEPPAGPEALHSEIADAALIGTISIPEVERYEESLAAQKVEAFGRSGELADLQGDFTAGDEPTAAAADADAEPDPVEPDTVELAEVEPDAVELEAVELAAELAEVDTDTETDAVEIADVDVAELAIDIPTADDVVWATDPVLVEVEVDDDAAAREELASEEAAADVDETAVDETAVDETVVVYETVVDEPAPEAVEVEDALIAEPEAEHVAHVDVSADVSVDVSADVIDADEAELSAALDDLASSIDADVPEAARIIRVVDPRVGDDPHVGDDDGPVEVLAEVEAPVEELAPAISALADATAIEVAPAVADSSAADSSAMDSLFDRLRTKSSDESEAPESPAAAAATEETATAEETVTEEAATEEISEPIDAHETLVVEEAQPAGLPKADVDDAAIVAERDAAINEVQGTMERRLKRVLADEQNHVLETIGDRKRKTSVLAAMPSEDTHADMYVAAIVTEIEACYRAGAAFVDPLAAVTLTGNAPFLANVRTVVEPLREMIGALTDTPEDDAATATVRTFYRSFKKTEIAVAASSLAVQAFSLGSSAAMADGTAVRWVFFDHEEGCPDGHDNSLTPSQRLGEQFPSGAYHPPTSPRCRCVLVPADR